eukprot:762638-Hanusia_phi.AAC.4
MQEHDAGTMMLVHLVDPSRFHDTQLTDVSGQQPPAFTHPHSSVNLSVPRVTVDLLVSVFNLLGLR